MLSHLFEISLRSVVLAVPAALAVWMLRRRRSAALEHAVWAAVVCGMLALYCLGPALPRVALHLPERAVATAAPAPVSNVERIFFEDSWYRLAARPGVAAEAGKRITWPATLLFAYWAIAAAMLAKFAFGMLLARRLRAGAAPAMFPYAKDIYESERVSVPVTIGYVRPVILLPMEWREWDHEKLDAVLAHEGAHVQRRDGLIAVLAGVNRSLLWFHPLAWWLERQVALLADQACDESSVAALGDSSRYARLLLEMAKVVDRSQGRLRRHALTMAASSHLKQRIEALLEDGRTFSRGLSRTAAISLGLCALPVLWAAGALQLDRKQAVAPPPAPKPPALAPKTSIPVRIAQAITAPAPQPPTPPAPVPQFDKASITTCRQGDGAGRSGRGGAGGRGIPMSPSGQLYVNCLTVAEMLDISRRGTTLLNDFGGPMQAGRIRGGPEWVYSDLYTINAETSDASVNRLTGLESIKITSGPMLATLLESRFGLQTHHAFEEMSMYALTVASGGFKLQPPAPGACEPHEPDTPLRIVPGAIPWCMMHTGWEGPNWTMEAGEQQIGNFARSLSDIVTDRPVLDKTGITGAYTFQIKFAHDAFAPGSFPAGMTPPFQPSDIPLAASLPDVLEQHLGLTLVPDKGLREYIVVDSAERPSEN